jgi:hypothetical protein
MKNILLILFAALSFTVANAQIESKLIGKWKVIGTESNKDTKLNKDEEKQLKTLGKAALEFKADGHAKFKQIFSSYNIPDGYWEYNKDKDVIIISEWDNRNVTLMRLWYDELDNGNIKFYIDETPYVLIAAKE